MLDQENWNGGGQFYVARPARPLMTRRRFVTASAGILCLTSIGGRGLVNRALADSLPGADTLAAGLRFRIRWKGDEIGYHRISLKAAGDQLTITTSIRMKVKMAFVTAFRYEHDCTEAWAGGRLTSLDSRTDNNGDKLKVTGKATTDGFDMDGPSGPFTAPVDALTTNSLWSPAFVTQTDLIDAQNGGMIGLVSKDLGKSDAKVAAARQPTEGFDLVTPYLSGRVWYDADARWVKGEFEREGERISYDLET
ncbi:DUF6134 family protein [Dongia sp.]|jgi:hypothetical protein|uniref:DUF6134 family protein n=1 Tax=Dongia sp. TaxID=1977262 RepID=UPI0034A4EA4E